MTMDSCVFYVILSSSSYRRMQRIKNIKSKFRAALKDIDSPSSSTADIIPKLKIVYDEVKASDSERKQILELTFRERIRDNVIASDGKLDDAELDLLLYLIDISIEALRINIIPNPTPFTLISDLFDCLTIDRCENLFTYIECNTEIWMEPLLYSLAKIYLLRICNEFLRRLSRSQNTIRCGRIQLFLARLFPMSEKSALNLNNQFNLANITTFGLEDSEIDSPKKPADSDTTQTGKVDLKLYESLWSIQDYFRDPNQCYDNEKWRQMTSHSDVVLTSFKTIRLDDEIARGYLGTNYTDDNEMDTNQFEFKESKYFTKFLTNPKLLELQLRDSLFRRHILLQYLVMFQYLECTTKSKPTQHIMKKEQTAWVLDTKARVFSLLSETPPNGEEFCEYVSKLLKREELWIDWKNEGCPPISVAGPGEGDKEVPVVRKELKRKRKLGEMYKQSKEKRIEIGSEELGRLWNLNADNMKACQGEDRKFIPELQDYFSEAIEQLDPENMIESEYKLINNSNWSWRALRLLSRKCPYFFQGTNALTKPIGEYLEGIIRQVSRDFDDVDSANTKAQSPTIPEMDIKTDDK